MTYPCQGTSGSSEKEGSYVFMKDKQGKILSGKSKVCLLVKQRKIRNIFFISFYFHNETLEGHRIDIPRPPHTHTHTNW